LSDDHYTYAKEFAEFHDVPESPFYESTALGLGPVDTWEHLTKRMDGLITTTREHYGPDLPFEVSPDLLDDWHREIFSQAFPEDGGRRRSRKDGGWEHVFFGANIGTRRSRRQKQFRGAHPMRIAGHQKRACREHNKGAVALRETVLAAQRGDGDPPKLEEATYMVARLYTKILRVHPWPDGNLRTAYVALQAALAGLDLPAIEFKDLERHDDMLGIAFQGDDSPYRGLSDLIAEIIRDAGQSE
jgi:fido (protein-threonine AMPylation protein)